MKARCVASASTVVLAALAAPPVAAQTFYLGVDASYARLQSGFASQVADAASSNFVPSGQKAEMKRAAGGRIFAGARVLEWLALEADYASLGEIETFYRSTSVHGAGFGFGETTTRMKADALGVSAVAHATLTQALSIHGRAGVARTRLRSGGERCSFAFAGGPQPTPAGCIGIESSDVAQASPIAGLGLDARLSDRWTLTAGWDRYFGLGKKFDPLTTDARGEFDIDRYAVGVSWRY